jgi:hypothetical protein
MHRGQRMLGLPLPSLLYVEPSWFLYKYDLSLQRC